jgi:hypothetical protein
MTAGIVTVVLLLVGFPLLMWWVGGRRFWNRAYGTETGELYRRIVREHRLTPAETAQVEGAVAWGRELQDERLRAAVVAWATALRERTDARRRAHPRRAVAARVVMVVWAGLLVVSIGLAVADGEWGHLVQSLFYAVGIGLPTALAARGPRRAIERNSGQPSARG